MTLNLTYINYEFNITKLNVPGLQSSSPHIGSVLFLIFRVFDLGNVYATE